MGDDKVKKSSGSERTDRIPPGQSVTEDWPVLHFGDVPRIDISKWTFTIQGLVESEKKLSYDNFMALPLVKVVSDIHCVTRWTKLDNLWEGVSSTEIAKVAKILPEAKFATVRGVGGFTTNLPLSEFFDEDVLFAVKHNGEILTPEHGYPVRLVVPKLYFWKSTKWVIGLEFTKEDEPGFWESRGYHNHGDPWKEERYGL